MTTDRELLEAAAKAAGIEDHPATGFLKPNGLYWNPLHDDGDALRLLNALELQLRHVHGAAHVGVPDKFWHTERYKKRRTQPPAGPLSALLHRLRRSQHERP